MHPIAPYGKRERREAQYQRQHGRDVEEDAEESLHVLIVPRRPSRIPLSSLRHAVLPLHVSRLHVSGGDLVFYWLLTTVYWLLHYGTSQAMHGDRGGRVSWGVVSVWGLAVDSSLGGYDVSAGDAGGECFGVFCAGLFLCDGRRARERDGAAGRGGGICRGVYDVQHVDV